MDAKSKVKIVSEGTGATTRLIDVETGEDLTKKFNITKITWEAVPRGLTKATVEMCVTAVEVIGELELREVKQ